MEHMILIGFEPVSLFQICPIKLDDSMARLKPELILSKAFTNLSRMRIFIGCSIIVVLVAYAIYLGKNFGTVNSFANRFQ
jgi:hypothetical protein